MTLAVHGRTESDQAEPAGAMFSSSRALAIATHLGIAWELHADASARGIERMRTARGTELLWPSALEAAGAPVAACVQSAGASVPIFARVLSDTLAEELLAEHGGDWSRAPALAGRDGQPLASIWQARYGSVFLPFDPDEVCQSYWSERYRGAAAQRRFRRASGGLRRAPVLRRPRRCCRAPLRSGCAAATPALQAAHAVSRAGRSRRLYTTSSTLLHRILADVAGEPVPRIATWPDGHTWALVLTHDVETAAGWPRSIRRWSSSVASGCARRGTSCRVATRLPTIASGSLPTPASRSVFTDCITTDGTSSRARACRNACRGCARGRALERRGLPLPGYAPPVGADAAARLRLRQLLPGHRPVRAARAAAAARWLPFFNQRDGRAAADDGAGPHAVRDPAPAGRDGVGARRPSSCAVRGGMALIDTHPDYLIDERIMGAYARLLERYADDDTARGSRSRAR